MEEEEEGEEEEEEEEAGDQGGENYGLNISERKHPQKEEGRVTGENAPKKKKNRRGEGVK